MPAAALVAAVALALVAARAAAEPPEIVVTRAPLTAPRAGCHPHEVAAVVVRFLAAVNRGDGEAIRRSFPEQDAGPPGGMPVEPAGNAFRWYSVTEDGWRHTVLYDLDQLAPYFQERRRRHERMTLVAVAVGPSRRAGGAAIDYVIRREADDLPSGLGGPDRVASGKGGIDCERGTIVVWSMGMTLGDGRAGTAACPKPPGWSLGDPVVACWKGPNARAVARALQGRAGRGAPAACAPRAAARHTRSLLTAFNRGFGVAFAAGFAPPRHFRPYGLQIRQRRGIAAFVQRRYLAGDGWTATALRPLRSRAAAARYRVRLEVTHQTRRVASSSATITVDCRSGLVRRWIGPALPAP